jgi:nicotinamidase/pyrazinamidase
MSEPSAESIPRPRRALIIVDVQNDFCEGGSLAVTGGARVAADVGSLLARWVEDASGAGHDWSHVVATRDHHVDPGDHWSADPDFVHSWPVHCRVGTDGEGFHPDLQPRPFDAIFLKGRHEAAYSGFEGRAGDGDLLADWLRARSVSGVDVCGIATDHCVRATVLDAVAAGFDTRVLLDLCAGVAPATTEAALVEMTTAGARVA